MSDRLEGLDKLLAHCHLFPLDKLKKNALTRLKEICLLSAYMFDCQLVVFEMNLDDHREDLVKKLLTLPTQILRDVFQHQLYSELS